MSTFSETLLHRLLFVFNLLQSLAGVALMGVSAYLVKEDDTDFARLMLLVSFIYITIGALGLVSHHFHIVSFPQLLLVILLLLWHAGLFISFVFFEGKSLRAVGDLEDHKGQMHDWFDDHSTITKIGLASALAFSIIYTGLAYRSRELVSIRKANEEQSTLPH